MKPSIIAALLVLTISFSLLVTPVFASQPPAVGVKKGDWIEYAVTVTGGVPPAKLNLTSYRIDILEVEGAAFQANFTSRFANGTISSAVWSFNFSEGNVGGWVIIPSGLNVGDTFFDSSKPANVTVEGEVQKVVAGAIRTITHASDAKREIKEWDKLSGVYTFSVEHPKNLTLTTTAVATNLWSPELVVVNQATIYPSIALVALAVLLTCLTAILGWKKKLTLQSPRHQKIVALIVFTVLLLSISAIGAIPLNESQLPLSFREINVAMQTFWFSLLLAGMWFRKRGNYFMHEILSIITVAATLVSFALVLVMSPPGGSDMAEYFSSALNVGVFFAHSIFSLPALAFGVWLVALWCPSSPFYPAKSRRAAQLTLIFWTLSYIAGIVDFVVLRMGIF
jgi:uncharacterized membrane protein YozB (DUF420 family)